MNWMLMPYKRYADFQGRSQRMEFWMFTLFQILVGVVFDILMFTVGGGMPSALSSSGPNAIGMILCIIFGLFGLASIIPSLAVAVRRLHDQNKTGWIILVGFIPLLGAIILLVLYCLDGTKGPNKFGPDPKGGDPVEAF